MIHIRNRYDTQGISNRKRVQADCTRTRVGDLEECAGRMQGDTRYIATITKRGVYHGGVEEGQQGTYTTRANSVAKTVSRQGFYHIKRARV